MWVCFCELRAFRMSASPGAAEWRISQVPIREALSAGAKHVISHRSLFSCAKDCHFALPLLDGAEYMHSAPFFMRVCGLLHFA